MCCICQSPCYDRQSLYNIVVDGKFVKKPGLDGETMDKKQNKSFPNSGMLSYLGYINIPKSTKVFKASGILDPDNLEYKSGDLILQFSQEIQYYFISNKEEPDDLKTIICRKMRRVRPEATFSILNEIKWDQGAAIKFRDLISIIETHNNHKLLSINPDIPNLFLVTDSKGWIRIVTLQMQHNGLWKLITDRKYDAVERTCRRYSNLGLCPVFDELLEKKYYRLFTRHMGAPFIEQAGTDFTDARLIFGESFISPKEMSKVFGLKFDTEQLKHLRKTLPPKKMLFWLKENGYKLIAAPPTPMTIFAISKVVEYRFDFRRHIGSVSLDIRYKDNAGYYEQIRLAKNHIISPGWLKFRIREGGIYSKRYLEEFKKELLPIESIANVCESFWFLVLNKFIKDKKPINNCFFRREGLVTNSGLKCNGGWNHQCLNNDENEDLLAITSDSLEIHNSKYANCWYGIPIVIR
ncbi:MAG: hypothetical protein ABH835_03355 [Patescibacteria group bacterium]